MKYIVGNWKMHLGIRESVALARGVLRTQRGREVGPSIILCPSFPSLAEVHKVLARSRVALGAQNCGFDRLGAFTGEVSVAMLEDISCSYVLLGHSERREIFGETDELIAKKMKTALASKITPILCIGEPLAIRKEGKQAAYVKKQLDGAFSSKETSSRRKNIFVAYEPIWAIGTKNPAKAEEVAAMHALIRTHLSKKLRIPEKNIVVLYGGSVAAENAYAFLREEQIDGLLVGGASIKLHEFSAILEAASEVIVARQ